MVNVELNIMVNVKLNVMVNVKLNVIIPNCVQFVCIYS